MHRATAVNVRGPDAIPFLDPLLSMVRFRANPVARLLALHPRFGDLFAVVDRSSELICAIGADHNHTVLSQPDLFPHEGTFPFRTPPGTAFERFSTSLVLLNGEQHRRHRRLLQSAFQRSALDRYAAPVVERCARHLRSWPAHSVIDVAVLIRELTLAAVLSSLFGIDVSGDAQTLGRLAVAQLESLSSPLTLLLPWNIPGTPFHRLLDVCEKLEAELRRLIAVKRLEGTAPQDAMALLLQAHDRSEEQQPFTDTELIGELNTLFVAGHETTANTLTWTLLLLILHPEVMAQLMEEISCVLGQRLPMLEDLPKLDYLGRVIDESMRLLPATPVLFVRVAAKSVQLGTHTLPAGTKVVLSPLLTHRDSHVYSRPLVFDPDRWLQLQPTPYQYLPFGAGARRCLGAAFAAQTLRLMLPMILQRFRPELPIGTTVNAVVRGITCNPHPGVPLVLHPQDGRPVQQVTLHGNVNRLVELPRSGH